MRYFFMLLVLIVELFLCLIVAFIGCCGIGGLISVGEIPSDGEVTIFINSSDIHTDFCLPASNRLVNWHNIIPPTHFPHVKGYSYLSIGWGDKGFYIDTPTWSDLTIGTAFEAMFLPSETAMHVSYHQNAPQVNGVNCFAVNLSSEKYMVLADYIRESFDLKNGKVALIPNKGYGLADNFYEAKGSYHLFNTCNSWVNAALKKINVKTGWFAVDPLGITRHFN